MPVPDDVADGVFRDLPPVAGLPLLTPDGPVSVGDGLEEGELALRSPIALRRMISPQAYAAAHEAQGSPSPSSAPVRMSLPPARKHTISPPDDSQKYVQDGAPARGGALVQSVSVGYQRAVYAMLRPDAVPRFVTHTSPLLNTYSVSDDGPVTDDVDVDVAGNGSLTMDGRPTLLPLPASALASAPSTPGTVFAGMSLENANNAARSGLIERSGLNVLAEAADFLEYANRPDVPMDLGGDGGVTPGRSASPSAGRPDMAGRPVHTDHAVPGVPMDHEVFTRQQQEFIRYQLQHDEVRANSAHVRLPRAQFYTNRTPLPEAVDPVLFRGYAPMEVDGHPAPRSPLAHACVAPSDSSEDNLYPPPPLDENLADDPPDAPQLVHLYDGAEIPGQVLHSGEVRYSHDIPVRASAAVSAAIPGASRDIPQIWHCGDYVQDARHLAGGHAAPPQPAPLPPVQPTTPFTVLPESGAPTMHFDDPEFLLKGLAQERNHVIFRQPQSSIALARIFNGGVPRANNVKAMSDSLGDTVHAITGARDFIIVPPAQAWGQELSLQDQPQTWIILRLRPEHTRRLVSQMLWSSHKITIMVFNRDVKFGRFIGRVGYYTHNIDNDIENSIRNAFSGPLILPSIRSLIASHPSIAADDIDPTVQRVLASLRVKVVEYPNGNITANVFCDSPAGTVEQWRTWVAYVRTVPLWSDLNPTGTFLRPIRCAGCAGADHPTFLCPFALLPGWNGPSPGAATIAGPATITLPGVQVTGGQASGSRGPHPYRGNGFRGRRGRGRSAPF
ncbi:hypothetical protein C8T65DRAFT_735481 [Cerioporus squamosus]|nr:hypothetical protein C8T65DRAFT_735481 [Cerioporus squamosus]